MPTSTVRYYERRKLLEPTTRSSGNYRMYDCELLERLLFIRSAQHAGFTLCDSSSLLEFRDGDGIGHLKRPFKFPIHQRLDNRMERDYVFGIGFRFRF